MVCYQPLSLKFILGVILIFTSNEFMTSYIKTAKAIKALTSEQFRVTQQNGTEMPGTGGYLDNKEPGLYVDVVSGEPLFLSTHKFDSGTGWPSFTEPASRDFVVEYKDDSYGVWMIEVRSKHADCHLGHVFKDGPSEQGGLRYCINSASLRFVPYDKMVEQGYGDYLTQIKV